MCPTVRSSHKVDEPSAASLRAVGIKATPTGRAGITTIDMIHWRGLDAADRPRTAERMAAPKNVARNVGSPKNVPCGIHAPARDHLTDLAPYERRQGLRVRLDRQCPRGTQQQTADR